MPMYKLTATPDRADTYDVNHDGRIIGTVTRQGRDRWVGRAYGVDARMVRIAAETRADAAEQVCAVKYLVGWKPNE